VTSVCAATRYLGLNLDELRSRNVAAKVTIMIEKQIGFPYRMVVCRTARQHGSMAGLGSMAAATTQDK
jgi:hypothetical protein